MIIYFEDGSITNNVMYDEDGVEVTKIDADNGYTCNFNKLVAISKSENKDRVIYTNSLAALSNRWCWSDELQMPLLYLRNIYGNWDYAQNFTNREIKYSYNLMTMYINGVFDVLNCEKNKEKLIGLLSTVDCSFQHPISDKELIAKHLLKHGVTFKEKIK